MGWIAARAIVAFVQHELSVLLCDAFLSEISVQFNTSVA
jgi:hypothetical protein